METKVLLATQTLVSDLSVAWDRSHVGRGHPRTHSPGHCGLQSRPFRGVGHRGLEEGEWEGKEKFVKMTSTRTQDPLIL